MLRDLSLIPRWAPMISTLEGFFAVAQRIRHSRFVESIAMADEPRMSGVFGGFSEPQAFTRESANLVPDVQGVHVVWDPNGDLLYVGQSKRQRTRLRQHLTGDRAASVLHKQVGEMLDGFLGREASQADIREWLGQCTFSWKEESESAALKTLVMDEFSPRFNTKRPGGGSESAATVIWDEYAYWAHHFFTDPDFAANERDYKMRLGERFAVAKSEMLAGHVEWTRSLRSAFQSGDNNLSRFNQHVQFLNWVDAQPQLAREALQALWADGDLAERIRAWSSATPRTAASGLGTRTMFASLLLLASDATAYPPYKPTVFRNAYRTLEFAPEPSDSEAATYLHALSLLDRTLEECRKRGLDMEDRLNAQGVLWTILNIDAAGVPDPDRLRRFRGETTNSVWWVNQRGTYEDSRDGQYIQASQFDLGGRVPSHWENITKTRPGDVVIHYTDQQIRAIGRVTKQGALGTMTDGSPGYVANVEYFELDNPISKSEIPGEDRIAEGGAFNRNGDLNQGYLCPLSGSFAESLRGRFADRWPPESPWGADSDTLTRETGAHMDERELIRLTLDNLVDEYRRAGSPFDFDTAAEWHTNSDAVTAAIEQLHSDLDLKTFARNLAAIPNPPEWFKQGAHKTFLGTLADRAHDPDAPRIVAYAFAAPSDESEARDKIDQLVALAEGVDKLYPGPGFAPIASSAMWAMVDADNWPLLNPDAEIALSILRILPRSPATPSDRYLGYRSLISRSSGAPAETAAALSRVAGSGSRTISRAVYERLKENSQLLVDWYSREAYASADAEARASRNIEAVLGEFDLFAKGMNESIGDRLVRSLTTSKTGPRVGFDASQPFRADGYAIFTTEKDMRSPSVRVWATQRGLAVGAHLGARPYTEAEEVASEIRSDLPPELEFFEVRPHKTGDRLAPSGREPKRGELFVGRWFDNGLTGADVEKATLDLLAPLQAVFDLMVRSAGDTPSLAAVEGDPLGPEYERFLTETGYPTDHDRTNKAEREQMAKIISEDGLLEFDLQEFRRIYNTSRYGGPGPQAILNTSLNQMTPDELALFAHNLEYLLRGAAPLEERINSLMPDGDRGVKGLGQSVITKLLAIENPDEIIPMFVYIGPKGKARMMSLLDIRDPDLDRADVGTQVVKSNEAIRERLAPLFGNDTYGMARFLYWWADHGEPGAELPDEIDHIANLADSAHVPKETLDEIVTLLKEKGQVIFYGPPGTGKTYLARELAKALAPDPGHSMTVQFHPSTSYEDFFEGFRPETDASGQLTYRLVHGPLLLIAERARENPTKQYVMVIDEINRANLPKVLGELLFLLEYRTESVRPLYRPDEPFELPKNLMFIGTMNTADRSIALIDAAMRRRFHFVPFFPNEGPMSGLLRSWLAANNMPDQVAEVLEMVNDELRERFGGPDLQIGPSHFMKKDVDETAMRRVWEYSVLPYIEEQLHGDQAAIDEYKFDRVMRRYHMKDDPDVDLEEDIADDSRLDGVE